MSKIADYEQYKKTAEEAAQLYNKKDYRGALARFQLLSEYNPDNFKVHETLSYIYLYLKDVSNAEREYRIALDLARKQGQLFSGEPVTFDSLVEKAGSIQVVEQEFKQLMTQKPEKGILLNSRTAIHLGILYMSRGEYKKAEQALTAFRDKFQVAMA